MKEYKSNYQQFCYDEELWSLIDWACGEDEKRVSLHYVGPIVNGAIVGEIPDGVKNAAGMFSPYAEDKFSNSELSVIPKLPDSLEDVTHMFVGTSITECPIFPAGVKRMFGACNATPFEDAFRRKELKDAY